MGCMSLLEIAEQGPPVPGPSSCKLPRQDPYVSWESSRFDSIVTQPRRSLPSAGCYLHRRRAPSIAIYDGNGT